MNKSLKISIFITLCLFAFMPWIGKAYPANTATQIDFILAGFSDASGNPYSGGKVEVYSAGTTIGKNEDFGKSGRKGRYPASISRKSNG